MDKLIVTFCLGLIIGLLIAQIAVAIVSRGYEKSINAIKQAIWRMRNE